MPGPCSFEAQKHSLENGQGSRRFSKKHADSARIQINSCSKKGTSPSRHLFVLLLLAHDTSRVQMRNQPHAERCIRTTLSLSLYLLPPGEALVHRDEAPQSCTCMFASPTPQMGATCW